MTRWLLFTLTACGRVAFDPLTDPTGDGGTGDGSTMMGSDGSTIPAACPTVGCAFPGGFPCSCWGSPIAMNAGLTESNGTLTITPNANTADTLGGCIATDVQFDSAGAIVEVSQVPSGVQAFARFDVGFGADSYSITVLDGTIYMTDGVNMGQFTYLPSEMRWWRIRPRDGGVIFETSAGSSWDLRYGTDRSPSTTYTITIGAGTLASDPAPGQARIESINLCLP